MYLLSINAILLALTFPKLGIVFVFGAVVKQTNDLGTSRRFLKAKSPKASKAPKSTTKSPKKSKGTPSVCVKPPDQYDYILVGNSDMFIYDTSPSFPDCFNSDLFNSIANYETEPCLGMGDGILIDDQKAGSNVGAPPFPSGIAADMQDSLTTLGASATVNSSPLDGTSLDVTNYKTLILLFPTSIDTTEEAAMVNFMRDGGRVIFMGASTGFASEPNGNVNTLLGDNGGDTLFLTSASDNVIPVGDVGNWQGTGDVCATNGVAIQAGMESETVVTYAVASGGPRAAIVADNIARM